MPIFDWRKRKTGNCGLQIADLRNTETGGVRIAEFGVTSAGTCQTTGTPLVSGYMRKSLPPVEPLVAPLAVSGDVNDAPMKVFMRPVLLLIGLGLFLAGCTGPARPIALWQPLPKAISVEQEVTFATRAGTRITLPAGEYGYCYSNRYGYYFANNESAIVYCVGNLFCYALPSKLIIGLGARANDDSSAPLRCQHSL